MPRAPVVPWVVIQEFNPALIVPNFGYNQRPPKLFKKLQDALKYMDSMARTRKDNLEIDERLIHWMPRTNDGGHRKEEVETNLGTWIFRVEKATIH